ESSPHPRAPGARTRRRRSCVSTPRPGQGTPVAGAPRPAAVGSRAAGTPIARPRRGVARTRRRRGGGPRPPRPGTPGTPADAAAWVRSGSSLLDQLPVDVERALDRALDPVVLEAPPLRGDDRLAEGGLVAEAAHRVGEG